MLVPYIPRWKNNPNSQTYSTEKSILVTSGCSFAASGRLDTCATTWPGILKERCGMQRSVEYGYPGSGNEYIADSILYHISKLNNQDAEKTLVVVMWSGINRFTKKNIQTNANNPAAEQYPFLNGFFYSRDGEQKEISDEKKRIGAQESADRIFQVTEQLTNKNISFAFSFYCNLLYPPYIPKPDLTHEFDKYVDSKTLADLKKLPIIPRKPMDFMFEYGFANDQLADDGFHPNYNGIVNWTDNVLLPGLVNYGLVKPV